MKAMSKNPNNFGDKDNILSIDGAVIGNCGPFGDRVIRVIDRLGINATLNNTLDGRKIRFVVREDDRIRDVKKKIRDMIRFDKDEHSLSFKELILKDEKCIGNYDIGIDSVIDVVPSSMEIQVNANMEDGGSFVLGVVKTISIANLKKKFQEKIGLSPDDQKLMYEGRILKDDKSINDYDINENSVINVVVQPRLDSIRIICSYICSCENKKYIFQVRDTDKIIFVKYRMAMKIRENKHVSDDKFADIRLFIDGTELQYDKCIGDYYIEMNDTILAMTWISGGAGKCYGGNRVMIGDDGDILDVGYIIHTVSDVKKSLQEKTGLSPEEQQLMYQGRILVDEDLGEFELIGVTLLDSVRRMFAQTKQGRTIVLQVKLIDRIIDIKRMIQAETGLPPYKQILRLSGTELIDDNMKVYQYKIVTNSNIDVTEVSRNMVEILSDNMETIMIEINNGDRVIDVKKRLEVKLGLPCGDQILKFQDKIMNDDDIMDSYIIRGLRDIINTILLIISGSSPPETRAGICVVISNETFAQRYSDRRGTKRDEDNIKNTFEPMGYEVEVHQNVSSSTIHSIFEDTKKKIKKTDRNMIVFVLSHGQENGVVMSDEAVLPFRNIWNPFSNEAFPEFAGKSKLFFFVCCLGSKTNNAVPGASNSTVQTDGPPSTIAFVPAMGDFFLGYATCESYVACREPSRGTLYIECLCQVVREHSRWSVSDIHQEVQKILSKEIMQGPEGKHFQMPHCDSMLREHAYFHRYL